MFSVVLGVVWWVQKSTLFFTCSLPSNYKSIPRIHLEKGKTMGLYDDRTERGREGDLTLLENQFAFVSDETKGVVNVCVSPFKTQLSQTDKLVLWNDEVKDWKYVTGTENAIQTFARAGQGQYIVLSNPALDGSHPDSGKTQQAVKLRNGCQVIVPGPIAFPLWPGQVANTVDGHVLRYNQYVLVRVINPVEAEQNWDKSVMAPVMAAKMTEAASAMSTAIESTPEKNGLGSFVRSWMGGDATNQEKTDQVGIESTQEPAGAPIFTNETPSLNMGQIIVIKGSELSFYIPSTGLEVIPDDEGNYVREAVTLEQLEYCVLLDESGEKRYIQGPNVVFPKPTETFIGEDGHCKYRAIELNNHSGLYIKVIAPYTDENGVQHDQGEELFITGAESAVYYPRNEHSIISYGEQMIHYAIAIPEGEGRYVLGRDSGEVSLVKGPKMFLPDPRIQVVVRRILDPKAVEVMYPGNREALEINRKLQAEKNESHDDYLSGQTGKRSLYGDLDGDGAFKFAGEKTQRKTEYTKPRTLVLDTKYEGAVGINVWPGYAVMIVDKSGNRRVEVGPKSILLEYDESLMVLELSTGKPKNTDTLLRAGYLRTVNNIVSDIVTVETDDFVPVKIKLSYRVNFEGESDEERARWFDIENYVKVLTDHCRSRLRDIAKQHGIQEFYADTIKIVRDAILGKKPAEEGERRGLLFEENGMRIYDVEVLAVDICDSTVERLLSNATQTALEGAIELSQAQKKAERTVELENLKRQSLGVIEETKEAEATAALKGLGRREKQILADIAQEQKVASERAKVKKVELAIQKARADQELEIQKAVDEAELERQEGETEQYLKRMGAISDELIAALQTAGDQHLVITALKELGPAAERAHEAPLAMYERMFERTPYAPLVEDVAARRKKQDKSDDSDID